MGSYMRGWTASRVVCVLFLVMRNNYRHMWSLLEFVDGRLGVLLYGVNE